MWQLRKETDRNERNQVPKTAELSKAVRKGFPLEPPRREEVQYERAKREQEIMGLGSRKSFRSFTSEKKFYIAKVKKE